MKDEKPDEEQVFEVGERTVMKMQSQSFLDEAFGTMAMQHASEVPDDNEGDEVSRLQRKVETLTNLVQTMQRRLDSIDAVVARIVGRQT